MDLTSGSVQFRKKEEILKIERLLPNSMSPEKKVKAHPGGDPHPNPESISVSDANATHRLEGLLHILCFDFDLSHEVGWDFPHVASCQHSGSFGFWSI